MHLVTGKPTWLCAKKSQHIDKKSIFVSLYKGTLFEGSKASPQKIMHILYCWSLKLTFVQTQAQTGASPTTVDRWFTIFRQICMDSLNVGVRAGAAGHRGFSPGDLSWQQARQQDATCSDREACGAGHHHLHGLLAGIQRSDGAGLPALHGEPLEALCGSRHRHTHSDDRVPLACIEAAHHQGRDQEGVSDGALWRAHLHERPLWRHLWSHGEGDCKAICIIFLLINCYSLFFISIKFFCAFHYFLWNMNLLELRLDIFLDLWELLSYFTQYYSILVLVDV